MVGPPPKLPDKLDIRALVVDDEPTLRDLNAWVVRRALGKQGTVETAADGDAGLRSLIQQRCDLLVTDLRMPGSHGSELVDHAVRAGLPCVVTSATPEEIDAGHSGGENPAVEILRKPYNAADLVAAVHRALHRRIVDTTVI